MSISCLKINNPVYTFLIALCFPVYSFSQSLDTSRIIEQLAVAHQHLEEGTIQEARGIADQLLIDLSGQDFPTIEAQVQWLLADIALVDGAIEVAEFWLDTAYCLLQDALAWEHPKIADALSHLGNLYFEKSYLSTAYRFHTQALQIRFELYGEEHLITAKSYNNIGNCFLAAGDYDQALAFYHLVDSIRNASDQTSLTELASSYNNLGNAYLALGEMNLALDYYQEVLNLRQQKYGKDHIQTAKAYQNMGNCLLALQEVDSGLYFFKLSADIYEEYYTQQHPKLADVYENMGNAFVSKKAYHEASELLGKALSIRLKHYEKSHPSIIRSYQNMGEYWMQRGDFQTALYHFRQASYLLKLNGIDYNPQLAQVVEQTGLALLNIGQQEEAVANLLNALVMRESLFGAQHPYVAGSALNLGNAYWQAEQWSKARFYYQKALSIWQDYEPEWRSDQLNAHLNIAYTYLEEDLPARALEELNQGRAYLLNEGVEEANYYRCLGEVLSNQGNYEKADSNLASVLSLLSYSSVDETPSPSIAVLLALEARAKNTLLWHQSNDTINLESALQWYQEAVELFNQLQSTYFNPEARQRLSALNQPLFEGAIATCYALVEYHEDQQYYRKAFAFSERNKSTKLLASRKWYGAVKNHRVDSLRQALQQAMASVNELEKKRAIASNTTEKRTLDQQIVQAQQYRSLLFDKLSKGDTNALRTTSYIDETIIDTLSNQLKEDEALISFFQGKGAIYVFVLRSDQLSGFRLPQSVDWEKAIIDMGRSILDYATAPTLERTTLDSVYTTNAVMINRRLFGTINTSLESINKLIVIPDGIFSCLPFEALLASVPEEAQRYRAYPYLLHHYELSYTYSATYWYNMLQSASTRKRSKNSCLAVAPAYEGHPRGLTPLVHNEEEVREVNRHLGGELLMGAQASKQNFLAAAPDYAILHLAAHAKSNSVNGDYSFLAFSHAPSDSITESFLYAKDLYGQFWNAELAVLSACETGMGSFQAGEGIVSLGRAFAQAGVKSTINSLWPINDARTAQLMSSFYKYLEEQHTKSSALRTAKWDYLSDATHESAHPFYWASYLPYGDMEPIAWSSSILPFWLWIVGGVVLIGVLWYIILRFYFSKS